MSLTETIAEIESTLQTLKIRTTSNTEYKVYKLQEALAKVKDALAIDTTNTRYCALCKQPGHTAKTDDCKFY